MKLALVSSPARESPEALPLGAASVAAAVLTAGSSGAHPELAGVEVAMISGLPGEGAPSLADRAARSGADAVGFSVYSWNRATLCEAARALRAVSPGAILFAGGPEATADPEGLAVEAGLDFAIAGEGEGAVVRALCALIGAGPARPPVDALRGIDGVAVPGSPWRVAGPEDPASLPSPWLLGVLDPAACGGDLVWELSRGCPFRCSYCYESKGTGGSRPFPLERVEAELELFVRSGARYAFVLDPTFDADAGRAALLLDLFRRKAPGLRWKFEIRAELLTPALSRRFAALDCSLQVGLQSARRETLEAIGRPGFDRRDFARKLAGLSAAGASFGIDLIYGLPGDRLSDFEEGLDFALGLGPNHLDLFPLSLLPGTELAARAGELGIVADGRPPYLVRSTREMGAAELGEAAALAAACDRFYSAGRAVAWFEAARKPLRKRASALLRAYGARFRGAAPAGMIEGEQLAFLEAEYRAAGLAGLVPALRDLVRLHGAWGRALAEGEESALDLEYDPEEALSAATVGLAAFARAARPSRGRWLVAPDNDEGARIERRR